MGSALGNGIRLAERGNRPHLPVMEPAFRTFAEFWPHYLEQHRRPATRALHVAGTLVGLGLAVAALARRNPALGVAAPVAAYGLAWLGHLAAEGNRPASFGHPLWSLAADLRMTGLFLAGRLNTELRRRRIGLS